MAISRNKCGGVFNPDLPLPYELRPQDFELALQDVYDLFFDVNSTLLDKGLGRLEDILERRKATLSGLLSDLLTASLGRHARALTENRWPNGHPDLIVRGRHPGDAAKAGEEGVEIKSTKNASAAVDMHGAHRAKNDSRCSRSVEVSVVNRGSGARWWPSKDGGIRHTPPFPLRSLACSFRLYSTNPYGGSVTTA